MDSDVRNSRHAHLPDEEVRRLIEASQRGDEEARNRLVRHNIRLVWSVVQRFLNRGYEAEDLFQIGCIGLLKAVDKFDLSYDVKFSTYAVPMIIGEIQRFLRDDGMVKVSRSLKELANRIVKGVRSFDMVARLGGEELVIVMPETRVSDAERAAERLRRMICDRPFDISAPRMQLPVSVSIGVSGLDAGDDAPDVILRRADEALYEAKRTGRNRVVMREPAGRASQAALA